MHRSIAVLALSSATVLSTLAHCENAAKLPPPPIGPLASYTYWPTQYVQWIGTELPYTMIELDVNKEGRSPVFYVSLTDRASGKRIHYANNDGLIAFAKGMHEEAYKTEIAFESDDTETVGSTSTLRLTLADGKPLQWRFVQGSDISEQGSGLTPLPDASIPILIYREQGGVAGEGTALQIGGVVSTADVWKEISHPPQFVAYRGAVTKNAHSLIFVPGKEDWTVTSFPAALTPGASWELDSPAGDHRSLHIDNVDGQHVMLTGLDRFQPTVHFALDATYSPAGWTVNQIRYAPVHGGEKHFAQLAFSPGLSSASGDSALSVVFGSKKPVAEGLVKVDGTIAAHTLTLTFANPGWLHGKTLTENVTSAPGSVSILAHP